MRTAQTFTVETAAGRQVQVSVRQGVFGSWIGASPVVANPIKRLTRITPVRWVPRGDEKYILENQ